MNLSADVQVLIRQELNEITLGFFAGGDSEN